MNKTSLMWADQSQSGLNTYQNGSSGFQMDVEGGDTDFVNYTIRKTPKTSTKKAQTWPQILTQRSLNYVTFLELHTTQEQTTFQVPSRMAGCDQVPHEQLGDKEHLHWNRDPAQMTRRIMYY